MAPLVAVFEVAGGLLLIAGIVTRWVSLWFIFEMIVITLLVKLPSLGLSAPQGKPGVGAELDLLLLVCALVLLTQWRRADLGRAECAEARALDLDS